MNSAPRTQSTIVALALAAIVSLLPLGVQAHCDSLDGPVVTDARAALVAGDVTAVLKWIAPADEAEIRSVFDKVLKVRQASEDARDLADMHFFETVVRLHRASEGAPYTGVKPAGTDPGPIVRAADAALASGSVDDLVEKVADHLSVGIRQRFAKASEAKARKDRSVDGGREFVAAYVEFVHYVENLHNAVAGHGASHGEAAPGGAGEHSHN